ncbi:hypothetical protein CP97_14736 [Aurantiacibacter atlanticus]|uniref:Uncharacterized protein n=1 Tax=Aurantiacibacter atlanticus TaxID=1648404 RepID=A0A161IA00_9SPHN|nr:hypothetical protein CP97_14736 [Aurantiacibacter atlanticus]
MKFINVRCRAYRTPPMAMLQNYYKRQCADLMDSKPGNHFQFEKL